MATIEVKKVRIQHILMKNLYITIINQPETIDDLCEGLEQLTAQNVEPNLIVEYLGQYKNLDWEQFAVWDPYR